MTMTWEQIAKCLIEENLRMKPDLVSAQQISANLLERNNKLHTEIFEANDRLRKLEGASKGVVSAVLQLVAEARKQKELTDFYLEDLEKTNKEQDHFGCLRDDVTRHYERFDEIAKLVSDLQNLSRKTT